MRLGLGVAGAIMALDQVTKWWIVEVVMNPPRVIPVTSFFNLVMGWNRGVSFGLFNTDSAINTWLLPALALAIVAALLYWLHRAESTRISVALGLVIGGALGNVVDRLHYDGVADFLDFYLGGYHWPAFNIADCGITLGAIVLVFDSLVAQPKKD